MEIGELSLLYSLDEASRASFGTVVGLALDLAGKLAIGITMIGLFLLKCFVLKMLWTTAKLENCLSDEENFLYFFSAGK